MHNRLVSALRQLGYDLGRYLEPQAIEDVCRRCGHTWRKRKLDPVTTIHLFILQVLAGNTAMTHLRHLAHLPVSDSAYCQARARLPLIVFEKLLARIVTFSQRVAQAASPCGAATD